MRRGIVKINESLSLNLKGKFEINLFITKPIYNLEYVNDFNLLTGS